MDNRETNATLGIQDTEERQRNPTNRIQKTKKKSNTDTGEGVCLKPS